MAISDHMPMSVTDLERMSNILFDLSQEGERTMVIMGCCITMVSNYLNMSRILYVYINRSSWIGRPDVKVTVARCLLEYYDFERRPSFMEEIVLKAKLAAAAGIKEIRFDG